MQPQYVRHVNTARTAVQTASLVVPGNNRCLCDHILPWWLTHELQSWKHYQPTLSFSSFITEMGKDGGQRIDNVSVEVNELRLFEPDLHSFTLRCGWFCKRWRDDTVTLSVCVSVTICLHLMNLHSLYTPTHDVTDHFPSHLHTKMTIRTWHTVLRVSVCVCVRLCVCPWLLLDTFSMMSDYWRSSILHTYILRLNEFVPAWHCHLLYYSLAQEHMKTSTHQEQKKETGFLSVTTWHQRDVIT